MTAVVSTPSCDEPTLPPRAHRRPPSALPPGRQPRSSPLPPGSRRRAPTSPEVATVERAQSVVARTARPAALALRGVLWAALLVASVLAGPVGVAVLAAPVAALAALSATRASQGLTWRRGRPGSTRTILSALLVGVAPAAALGGVLPACGVAAVVVGLGVLAGARSGAARATLRQGGVLVAPLLAGVALVVAAEQGTESTLVLVAAVLTFDLANAVMGSGRSGGILGASSGFVAIALLAVLVESLLDPPFTGSSAYLLCGAVALLAPLGVAGCAALVPGRAPALRRLDALVLAAPAWVVLSAALLARS